ncbi:hypothetical protein LTR91_006341 [Friedmanniomyces endolithicus]|uniref:Zn(2)-C6 fungal-type domain-containing protein n=1 Tax=Friedmanniomyces endolithicus TaxID=329885 RepID=A0AAN6QWX8_9PEZI|nr:hypothetical protein LTS00_015464 [Friedmanniomyces endolithicus]KAK0290151.1 hypothetical protein LTR35_002093 [Friedmanniomyces endolithicus]KAK0305556.1 hypothetical protein LTR01_006703 [Friedmanniomyces endolithicus]KAK0319341.1 hypothetical protein LTR82_009758 [Friedmanniomyces endolithicus]KAK0824348.1 hypothetical protein LTR73_007826 [Friedmanniomyces endolithicus]
MVNVGGRSKGCANCRRRRVKCDETRPVCKRCERQGLACEGVKEMTFIEATIVQSRRSESRTTGAATSGPSTRQISRSPSLEPMKTEICLSYIRKWLYRGSPVDMTITEMPLRDMDPTGSPGIDLRMSHQVILSFAFIVFGTHHGQTLTAQEGYSMYGKALLDLNEAMSDPACYTQDEVYLSVVSLACFETLARTSPGSRIKHTLGLGKLLELRGPAAYCSQKSYQTFNCVSALMLATSLNTGTPSILARTEWKAALRARCTLGLHDTREQDLHDLTADCTVLNAEREALLAKWPLDAASTTAERADIEQRALSLRADLLAWRQCWESDPRNTSTESPPVTTPDPLQPHEAPANPKPTPYEFRQDSAAIMLMMYNTTLIHILRILASLPQSPSPSPSPPTQTQTQQQSTDPYRAVERQAAIEISRCVPYYLNAESREQLGSSPILCWAIIAALKTLGGKETLEGGWMMEGLESGLGADIARLL